MYSNQVSCYIYFSLRLKTMTKLNVLIFLSVLTLAETGIVANASLDSNVTLDEYTVANNETEAITTDSMESNVTRDENAVANNRTEARTTPAQPVSMESNATTDEYTVVNKTTEAVTMAAQPVSVPTNCKLKPKNLTAVLELKDVLYDGLKMIRYNMILKNNDGNSTLNFATSQLFEPFSWVKVNGRQGTGLLYLRDQFDILSIFTLAIGVREIDVEFTESPEGCMGDLDVREAEAVLRDTVMNGLNVNDTEVEGLLEMKPKDRVCNMHILNSDGYADFRYYCCRISLRDQTECEYLEEDFWINILMYIIKFLQVLIVLFAPVYIPKAYYTIKDHGTTYVHKLADDVKLNLIIMLTTNPAVYSGKLAFRLSKFKEMPRMKTIISNLKLDTQYQVNLREIQFTAEEGTLLPEHVTPVGLWSKLYESFVMCNLRKNKGLKTCCDAKAILHVTWYKILRGIMMFFASIVFISPWIFRVVLYFFYEHEDTHMRKTAAYSKNLYFRFPGSYTLYLTPLHVIFIIIYVMLSIEYCIYGVLGQKVKNKFKHVLQACFKDMRKKDKGSVIAWTLNFALKPCTDFGIFGIFIGAAVWLIGLPFVLLFLTFKLIPTVNITIRLIAHFIAFCPRPKSKCKADPKLMDRFDPERVVTSEKLVVKESIMKSMFNRIVQMFVIIFCIVSLFSILFLLTELAAVIIEITVYTLMGLILNASKTLAFVSLFFLLAVYGTECFGHVKTKFQAFNQVLNKAILKLGEKKCEEVMYMPAHEQRNNAFVLETEKSSRDEQPVDLLGHFSDHPKWRLNRLVLFFSRYDVPQIPMSLFFKACKMPFDFVPGTVLKNYVKAATEFGGIVVFLIFVFLVVAAFGDSYKISTSNQLLATVVGGLLPKLLQKVFQSHDAPKIDENSIQFKVFLHELLEDYAHNWPIFDFLINSEPEEINHFPKRCSVTSVASTYHSTDKYEMETLLNGHATEMQEMKALQNGHATEMQEMETLQNGHATEMQERKTCKTLTEDLSEAKVSEQIPDSKINDTSKVDDTNKVEDNTCSKANDTTKENEVNAQESLIGTGASLDKEIQTGEVDKRMKVHTIDMLIDVRNFRKDDFPELHNELYNNLFEEM